MRPVGDALSIELDLGRRLLYSHWVSVDARLVNLAGSSEEFKLL